MESFHISNDLIDEKDKHGGKFGNMTFYKKGSVVINKKMIGLYITLFLLIGSYSVLAYLM